MTPGPHPSSIRGLRVFCAAARSLSFKTAADQLCVSPSAVSHQIKGLGEQLDAPLFEQRTREVALTDLGSALFRELEPLIAEVDNVMGRFAQRGRRRRVLRISLLPFFASEMFLPRFNAFADEHRAIDIRVETVEPGAVHPLASDVSILLLPQPPAGMRAEALFDLRLAPACAPHLACDIRDPRALLDTTLIAHKARPGAWQDWFASMSIRVDRRLNVIQLDSLFAVARAAERGLGVALVPIETSDAWFRASALVRPCEGELETGERYYFVYRPQSAHNPDVCALRDWVVATFVRDRGVSGEMSAVA